MKCPRCNTDGAYVGFNGESVECINRECYFYSFAWDQENLPQVTEAPTDLSSQGPHDVETKPVDFDMWLDSGCDILYYDPDAAKIYGPTKPVKFTNIVDPLVELEIVEHDMPLHELKFAGFDV